MQAFQE
jgi:GT2 family glycosyltransferase